MNYLNDGDLNNQSAPPSISSEKATELIIERARQLVNQSIENRGHDKPPFLSEEFARLLGVKNIVKADLGKVSGILLRFHEGHVIKVNQNHNMARQNFSCAHEIGHILFSELKLDKHIQNIEHRTFNPQAKSIARDRTRERLCHTAAAELLMPEVVFRKYLSNFGVSIHSLELLADIFKVSIQAAARRISEVGPEPCIALFWKRLRKNSKSLRFAWQVGPGRRMRGKAYYIPVNETVTYPSQLHKAYESDSTVKSFKTFKHGTDIKRLPLEAKGFGYGENRYVISLAFLDR